jgi:hypothetical protein
MVITTEKKEMTTGNNLLHGAGRGFKIYLSNFAVNKVTRGTDDERRKTTTSDGTNNWYNK